MGDNVALNTTAVDLSLGTGGYHFIVYNYSNKHIKSNSKGHIMKLRYTPLQLRFMATEEQNSPYHTLIKSFKSLDGALVLVGSLHSMLAPISAMIKWLRPHSKINYIMTDTGALPIDFSNTVKELQSKGIIDNTITIGHSFGGDFECINIYTGLITSKEITNSDVTIVCMGPGIVGSGTKYGFSGIEQGRIIDDVNILGGLSYGIPRISFADKRKRHKGISHHTLTSLGKISQTKCNLVVPILNDEKNKIIKKQINDEKIHLKHNIIYEDGSEIKNALDYFNLKVCTMGRDYNNDKDYFISLGAVGKASVKCLEDRQ